MLFQDRSDAGRRLARRLKKYEDTNSVILALPRGGVPVGYEIACSLYKPLDVFIVRKIGVPENPELALGAITSGGTAYADRLIMQALEIDREVLENLVKKELEELMRRERVYRGNHSLPKLSEKIVILVDDGLATGATMQAAIRAIRKLSPEKIIVAVPVCPQELVKQIQFQSDEFICLKAPEEFRAVGSWYNDFSQLTDDDVITLLHSVHSSV